MSEEPMSRARSSPAAASRPRTLIRSRRSRSKAWVIPAVYAAAAIVAGLTFPRLEATFLPSLPQTISVSAATAIYSSIASGMLALTGIVFSLTILMVQFSATAYSPRLVLWVARDPVVSHALGVFTATFLYALAALAWVDRGSNGRVLFLSAIFVIVLLVASVFVIVAMLQRVALLQINRMLTFTGDQGRQVIDTTYPPLEADGSTGTLPGLESPFQSLIHHGRPAVIQAVDVALLVALAREAGGVIEMTAAVGDTAVESTELLRVIGARTAIQEEPLLDAIQMGEERTFDQDPKYAIRLLVDIAIRALSPAVNDPTTGVQALDQIGDLLYRLGGRRLEIGVFHDDERHPRLVIPSPTWEDFLALAFDEIRAYGAGSVQITRRMSALIADLVAVVPEERRPALDYWQRRLHETVVSQFPDPHEQEHALLEDRQGLGAPRRRVAHR